MTAIKILIIEDEAIIAENLRMILENYGYDVVDIAARYEEAITAIEKYKLDFVLLDITIKGEKDGIELAHFINDNYGLPFVFLTSHSDKATIDRAKSTSPYGYLIKPFDNEDVYAAIEMALSRFAAQLGDEQKNQIDPLGDVGVIETAFSHNDSIFVRHKNAYQKLLFENIVWLEADDNYTRLNTEKQQFITRLSLKNLNSKLPSYFFRVHKSFVINCKKISAFNSSHVYLGEKAIPIGRRKQAEFMLLMNVLSKE